MSHPEPVPSLASVCGLYCGACSVFLASGEDTPRLAQLAARLGQTLEETRCEGCRSDRRSKHCQACRFSDCAAQRGLAFCGACAEYPCAELEAFLKAMPHRRDVPADVARIAAVGAAAWIAEVPARYACPACGAINSAYDLSCRACHATPGSAFVRDHGAAVRAHLEKRS